MEESKENVSAYRSEKINEDGILIVEVRTGTKELGIIKLEISSNVENLLNKIDNGFRNAAGDPEQVKSKILETWGGEDPDLEIKTAA